MISEQAQQFHERCIRFGAGAEAALRHMNMKDYADQNYSSQTGETPFGAEEVRANDVTALWVSPAGVRPDVTILFLHGGGYQAGSPSTHSRFAAHLARRLNARALLPDYRMLSEATFPAQIEDCVAVYRWLVEGGVDPHDIVFAGESAGGALVVTTQLLAISQGLPAPAAGYSMSPWIDCEFRGESHQTNVATDLMVTREAGVTGFQAYGGERFAPTDPLFNPLYADLSRIAPLFAQPGGDEVMRDDAALLVERAIAQGVIAEIDVVPHMQHTFQMCAGRMPEADAALDRGAAFLRRFVNSGRAGSTIGAGES